MLAYKVPSLSPAHDSRAPFGLRTQVLIAAGDGLARPLVRHHARRSTRSFRKVCDPPPPDACSYCSRRLNFRSHECEIKSSALVLRKQCSASTRPRQDSLGCCVSRNASLRKKNTCYIRGRNERDPIHPPHFNIQVQK